MKKILPILLSVFIVSIAISKKHILLDLVRTESHLAILVSILFVALLVFFPVVPYVVLAGLIGSVFGIWIGITLSLIGIGLGTMAMFFLARYGFQDLTQSYLKKFPRIQEYESWFEQNAFMGIMLARFIPIIPSPIINILSGLSKVKWTIFLTASLVENYQPSSYLLWLVG
jgi:uncharacterized membrane protein YdjX (TVP38/TMEM64 family)